MLLQLPPPPPPRALPAGPCNQCQGRRIPSHPMGGRQALENTIRAVGDIGTPVTLFLSGNTHGIPDISSRMLLRPRHGWITHPPDRPKSGIPTGRYAANGPVWVAGVLGSPSRWTGISFLGRDTYSFPRIGAHAPPGLRAPVLKRPTWRLRVASMPAGGHAMGRSPPGTTRAVLQRCLSKGADGPIDSAPRSRHITLHIWRPQGGGLSRTDDLQVGTANDRSTQG